MKQLLIEYNPFFVRTALTEDGELVEFGVEHVTAKSRVGNIYKGKVENVLAGMKAAFVNVGLERNGFLYVGDDDSVKVSAGDIVMCQVVKEQMGAKGARLSTDISLAGYTVVLLPAIMLFSLGLSYFLSALYVFFRDLKHIYSVILTLWTYLTPLFYTIDALKNQTLEKFMKLNPMYHYVEYFRDLLIGTVPSLEMHIVCYGFGIAMFVIGYVFLSAVRNQIAARL